MNGFKYVFVLLVILVSLGNTGCKQPPYFADEEAIVYLQAIPADMLKGETCRIVIRGEKGNGYPLPDGTLVLLSVTRGTLIGEIELVNGRGEAVYSCDNGYVGEVVLTARCGKATISPTELRLTIFEKDVAFIVLNADPQQLGSGGGNSSITATALDEDMQPVVGKGVSFFTTSGTISPASLCTTDASGKAQCTLSTSMPATVSVKYKDVEASVNIQLQAKNIKPSALFIFSPQTPLTTDTIYFNASACTDSDGYIVRYEWSFGDGTSASGRTAQHVYTVTATKTFVVVLTVVDDRGGQASSSKQITVGI